MQEIMLSLLLCVKMKENLTLVKKVILKCGELKKKKQQKNNNPKNTKIKCGELHTTYRLDMMYKDYLL